MRIGFPVNAVISVLVAAALVFCAWRGQRISPVVVAVAAVFQVASLGALITTRVSSLFGWAESSWTPGANLTRAVEIGALLSLAAFGALAAIDRRRSPRRTAGVPI